MIRRRVLLASGLAVAAVLAACESNSPTAPEVRLAPQFARAPRQAPVGINVVLAGPATASQLAELGGHGQIVGRIDEINALFLVAPSAELGAIRSLPFVTAANLDAPREATPPLPPVEASDFAAGWSTWDLDAIGVTDPATAGRTVAPDGSGVYVGVLDTGLLQDWRYYLPEDRIAVEYARSFTGGGALGGGAVPSQPNKWERDVESHGTHVTSTILGYYAGGPAFNGVAPRATVIPVKVLNNNGAGWSSTIAHGIVYIASLKAGPLSGSPVVINMSLGGSQLDATEKAAIDYAISQGVIVVAAAGNEGDRGMGYPGAYAPVISVGAVGWTGEWLSPSWFFAVDVPDPTSADDFYVTSFSSREKPGQDLDVLAPGSWVLGPWQPNQGHVSYYYVGGTSQATPHVAGVVALLAQVDPGLTASEAETLLESTAVPLPAGTRSVTGPSQVASDVTWGDDANGSGIVSATAALEAVSGP